MADMNALGLAVGAIGTILGGGGFWAYVTERRKTAASSPADVAKAHADLADALTRQTEAFIGALQKDREAQIKEIGELRERVSVLERENEQCRSENRDLVDRVATLEEALRLKALAEAAQAIPPGALVTLEGKTATILNPLAKPAASRRRGVSK